MEKRYLEGNARVAGYGTLKVVSMILKTMKREKTIMEKLFILSLMIKIVITPTPKLVNFMLRITT